MRSPTKSTSTRTISASEIARNGKHFETWSMCHSCEQASFSDLPQEFKDEITSIFDVEGKLPLSLVRESASKTGQLSCIAPNLASFIRKAYKHSPSLFSEIEEKKPKSSIGFFSELACVQLAWNQLKQMKPGVRWSESDYAANVYNVFRTPAIHQSACRNQCMISLPERLPHTPNTAASTRVLRARSVIPDGAIFIRASQIRPLSDGEKTPYKRLANDRKVRKHCGTLVESTFRYQSSPCLQPPEHPAFEFASSFWEDKKPNYELLESAYRQNRMATTSALRHLHSLGVKAPVIGLMWSRGVVRAHVDWWSGEREDLTIQSAPFPGLQPISTESNSPSANTASTPNTSICSTSSKIFHEWHLDKPEDILRVFLIIRNIDSYTADAFFKRVQKGLLDLVAQMNEGGDVYRPWKISPTAGALRTIEPRTNANPNLEIELDEVDADDGPILAPVAAPPVQNPIPVFTGFPTPPQAPGRRVRDVFGNGKGKGKGRGRVQSENETGGARRKNLNR